jgi:hypothetical protein
MSVTSKQGFSNHAPTIPSASAACSPDALRNNCEATDVKRKHHKLADGRIRAMNIYRDGGKSLVLFPHSLKTDEAGNRRKARKTRPYRDKARIPDT